jgi:hypothetical protein
MSIKKFGINDIVLNTMKAHPKSEFFIFSGSVFYNNQPSISGAFTGSVLSVSGSTSSPLTGSGFISLYEYNIDKSSGQGRLEVKYEDSSGTEFSYDPPRYRSIKGNPFSYPFISKDSAGSSFRTAGAFGVDDSTYANEFSYGDELHGKYPMSASITREYMDTAGHLIKYYDDGGTDSQTGIPHIVPRVVCVNEGTEVQRCTLDGEPQYRHYWSLKNRLNFYGVRSEHYRVTGSRTATSYEWIKDQQTINMVSVPSIFYGSRIQPGSVSLRWYFTGSLKGELRDNKQNGELIQVTTSSNSSIPDNSGSVAGVVLYEEGIILLTGSWALSGDSLPLVKNSNDLLNPKWIYFGAGANDGVNAYSTGGGTGANPATRFNSASFGLSFKGETDTQVVTMFANARRGEVNYSNNPTFLEYGQNQIALTSSQIYEENSSRLIKNTVSSSYAHQSASFERQVYVSRVALYDANKNLIGIATLANPVLKKEDQDLTFKLRLDI